MFMFKNMHVYNTWVAAVLADATIEPFGFDIEELFFIYTEGFEEAAYLDGCNKFTAFIRILIRLQTGLWSAIFSFLYAASCI